MDRAHKGPLVIGIGNPWRGDDGIGHAVVDALVDTPGLATAKSHGEPAELMALWQGHDPVILVDAIVTGAAPGTLHRLDAREPLPRGARYSSHGIGLAEAVELARSLGELPDTLIVHGIEPTCLKDAADLSHEVRESIASAVSRITDDLAAAMHGQPPCTNRAGAQHSN
ncbi:hydrogenase maturation protease [Thioalkalivibrio sp. ALJ2]|uniref:hydrogenase maturation protease n=1 Tax=Thioalkalivibrio sp. ALJ2 TaxID=1261622 RepID=UPI00036C190A|nr:hydrogenase maturation protease [Thioalkalivibrio sp. ALJ2]